MDAIKLTNAETTDEVSSDRVAEAEITVIKDDQGNYIFPVIAENWTQPHDGRKATRRILKNGDLVEPKVKTVREGHASQDEDDESNSYEEKVVRSRKAKRAPDKTVDSSESEAASSKGGDSEADTEASEEQKYLPDYWLLTRDVLTRVHNTPRKVLCTPNEDPEDPSPIPVRFLDIMRRTTTSSTAKAESIIEDHWVEEDDARRELTDEWIGQTIFYLRKPACDRKGYEWQNCRETRVNKASTRPPSVWVEVWGDLNKKDREKEILAWDKEKRARDKCRGKYQLVEQIPKSEAQEYNFLVRDMLTKYSDKKPPAMPCTFTSDEESVDGQACASTEASEGNTSRRKAKVWLSQKERNSRRKQREHMGNIQPIGYVDEEYMAMIHTEAKHEVIKRYLKLNKLWMTSGRSSLIWAFSEWTPLSPWRK